MPNCMEIPTIPCIGLTGSTCVPSDRASVGTFFPSIQALDARWAEEVRTHQFSRLSWPLPSQKRRHVCQPSTPRPERVSGGGLWPGIWRKLVRVVVDPSWLEKARAFYGIDSQRKAESTLLAQERRQ